MAAEGRAIRLFSHVVADNEKLFLYMLFENKTIDK